MPNPSLETARAIQASAKFTARELDVKLSSILRQRSQAVSKSRKKREALAAEIRRYLGPACIEGQLELKKLKYSIAVLCRSEGASLADERAVALELHYFTVPLNGETTLEALNLRNVMVEMHTLKRMVQRAGCSSFPDACRMLSNVVVWSVFNQYAQSEGSHSAIQTQEGTWGVRTNAITRASHIRTFIPRHLLGSGKRRANLNLVDACKTPPRIFQGYHTGQTVCADDLISSFSAGLTMNFSGYLRDMMEEIKRHQDEELTSAISGKPDRKD